MSTYRYFSTNLVTGQVVMNDIPLAVQQFTSQISGTGYLQGSLTLRSDMSNNYQLQALSAIEPWKVALWVLCDNQVVWGGPVTAWSSTSAQGQTLSFTAATFDSILQYRIYDENTDFINQDAGLIFFETLNYALNKKLPYSPLNSVNYANKAVGVKNTTFSITGSNFQDVQSIWNSIVQACDVEYCFQPRWNQTSTAPQVSLVLGQTIGRPLSANHLNLTYPSYSVFDYAYYQQNNQTANHVIATATSSVTEYGTGVPVTFFESSASAGYDLNSLGQGHTLLEQTYSAPNSVTQQSDIDAVANTQVKTLSPLSQLTPGIYLAPDAYPHPYDIQLGDWIQFSATSPLHPSKTNGGPGVVLIGRISNITVVPAQDGQVEQMLLILGQCNQVV